MYTIEEKVDLILRYIVSSDMNEMTGLRQKAAEMLQQGASHKHQTVDYDALIHDFLKELGMPCRLKGYRAATVALKLCILDEGYLEDINKNLYPAIALRNNTTPPRVERVLRHAIEVAFERGDIDTFQRLFGNTISLDRGKLTNHEFLAACTYELRHRARQLENG